MIKKRLSKNTMRIASHRPTTFERAKREHHGSVQKLPGTKGEFIKVKGEPGNRQVLKWWGPEGRRKQKWVQRGTQAFKEIGGDVSHLINKGEERTWYNKKGAFEANYTVKRKGKQAISVTTPGAGPEADSIVIGRPYTKETRRSRSRTPNDTNDTRKSKRTRRIPLTK